MTTGNPFLSDVPFVAIIKTVVSRGGRESETPDGDCKRVWFRVKARSVPDPFSSAECFPDNHYRFPSAVDVSLKEW